MSQFIPVYHLVDYAKIQLEGIFYENELQRIYADEKTVYNIEKVLEEKTENGVKKSLVRWVGWPAKFDSWILTRDVNNKYKKIPNKT